MLTLALDKTLKTITYTAAKIGTRSAMHDAIKRMHGIAMLVGNTKDKEAEKTVWRAIEQLRVYRDLWL